MKIPVQDASEGKVEVGTAPGAVVDSSAAEAAADTTFAPSETAVSVTFVPVDTKATPAAESTPVPIAEVNTAPDAASAPADGVASDATQASVSAVTSAEDPIVEYAPVNSIPERRCPPSTSSTAPHP